MTTRIERLRRYGLDESDYQHLDHLNTGKCWICGEPERVPNRSLAVDHCHTTGRVRGLLCTRCNQVLGRMNDDPKLLRQAASYLENATAAFRTTCPTCRVDAFPNAIASTNGDLTQFAYECIGGHAWTHTFNTKGADMGFLV